MSGHVTPNPSGAVARCGGPGMCSDCARGAQEAGQSVLTGLTLSLNAEPWDVFPDTKPPEFPDFEDIPAFARTAPHRSGADLPVARLRRIGWLDQRGRVWLKVPDGATADGMRCGSFTPLLIDPGERDGC